MELKNNLDPKKLVCGRCLEKPPIFSNARSAIKYNQQSKKLVLSLKYFDRTDTASAFAKWIITCGQDIIDKSDLIIPVPMHKTRLINRKYNQASLLANKIAEKTNKEISHTILIRKKRTLPQKQGREKRAQNVKNAFEVKNRNNIKNKKILLIDDVITSGATINECSKELIKNGANNVFALSLARA
ncbi:MAG: ComF family protein [Alphaproteobacteria bacterium]|nr:ComF family protein [Alphaproteobacteria bacterium]